MRRSRVSTCEFPTGRSVLPVATNAAMKIALKYVFVEIVYPVFINTRTDPVLGGLSRALPL
jgi:hypothetical protein